MPHPNGLEASRHVTYSGTEAAPWRVARGGVWTTSCLKLFPDPVRPSARGVLGRVNLLTAFAAQDADEAAYGVRLPFRGGHDLGQGCAFGPLHQRNHFGLLVGAIRFWFGGRFLSPTGLLRGLGFLGWRALALGPRSPRFRGRGFLHLDCVRAHWFLLDRAAVVTLITLVERN